MFFDPERIPVIQEMILARDAEERKPATAKNQRMATFGLYRIVPRNEWISRNRYGYLIRHCMNFYRAVKN